MSDRILPRFTNRVVESQVEAVASVEGEAAEDFGAFGWLRGTHDRAIMLELRKKDGSILAVSYFTLDKIEFDPSEGITLHTGRQTITIKGRNLNGNDRSQVRLFHGITRHRIAWVQEADRPSSYQAGTLTPVVASIEW
jgi:hypothetical protein